MYKMFHHLTARNRIIDVYEALLQFFRFWNVWGISFEMRRKPKITKYPVPLYIVKKSPWLLQIVQLRWNLWATQSKLKVCANKKRKITKNVAALFLFFFQRKQHYLYVMPLFSFIQWARANFRFNTYLKNIIRGAKTTKQ